MERKAAFGRVELMGGYADVEQNAVDPVQAALRQKLLHIGEVALDDD